MLANNSNSEDSQQLRDSEDSFKVIETRWFRPAMKTALLWAASHGHSGVVGDILRQTSRTRKVAAVDTELYDIVNCVDSLVWF